MSHEEQYSGMQYAGMVQNDVTVFASHQCEPSLLLVPNLIPRVLPHIIQFSSLIKTNMSKFQFVPTRVQKNKKQKQTNKKR